MEIRGAIVFSQPLLPLVVVAAVLGLHQGEIQGKLEVLAVAQVIAALDQH
jgi:hypothetical protein